MEDNYIFLDSVKSFLQILCQPQAWCHPLKLYNILLVSDALQICCWMVVFFALICLIASQLTGNVSQTDRLWSITPWLYAWVFACYSNWNSRTVLMACLATVWGLRLSYNAYRRGFFTLIPWKGHEDYRWEILRNHRLLKSPLVFFLFELIFISIYQHILLFTIALPSAVAWLNPHAPLNFIDLVATVLVGLSIVVEAMADNQQLAFQTKKYEMIKNGEVLTGDYASGFNQQGLFRYCRHPNYTAEQGVWWFYYLFGIAASNNWLNFGCIGFILYFLLFMGSTIFTESITERKYELYKEYKKSTPCFIPIKGCCTKSKSQ